MIGKRSDGIAPEQDTNQDVKNQVLAVHSRRRIVNNQCPYHYHNNHNDHYNGGFYSKALQLHCHSTLPTPTITVTVAPTTSTTTTTRTTTTTTTTTRTTTTTVPPTTTRTTTTTTNVPSGTSVGPAPTAPAVDWSSAKSKAQALVAKLTSAQKAQVVSGIGQNNGFKCIGNIGSVSTINFPGMCLQDSPTGVRSASGNSAFPAAINVAATFDHDLILAHAQAIGAEFRGMGVNVALGPMMNFLRAPEAGRNWEGAGEDPYLQSVHASLLVQGIQSQGVIATAKHYIGNEQEHGRQTTTSSNIDERTLHEIYLEPFRASIEAGVGSVMCSYNKLDGVEPCANTYYLDTVLKKQLGFQGFVMSDWWATKTANNPPNNGMDMMMPGTTTAGSSQSQLNTFWWGQNGQNLPSLVNSTRLDDMATRVLAAWLLMGQDSGFPTPNLSKNVQSDHASVIRKVGAASTVLLKNDGGVLPLKKGSVAVIGSDAAANPNLSGDHNDNTGTLAIGWGSGTANFPYIIAPGSAIQSRGQQSGISVTVAASDSVPSNAGNYDTVIVFVKANSGEGYLTVNNNAGDRQDLSLWNNGDNLITQAAAANKNVIVVMHTVGPVTMPWLSNSAVKAVIWAGLPGQETGNAIADVLFGDVNPSGRLPFTIYPSRSDYCCDVDYNGGTITYPERLTLGYRWASVSGTAPLFDFGHGLSYTTFSYSSASVSAASNSATVTVSIQNTGTLSGAEVVQVYLTFPTSANEPKTGLLRGFRKVTLDPNASATVTFQLTTHDLSTYVVGSGWTLAKGTFTVGVGASHSDIRSTATFTI
ncbi:hypothetical protein HDV00_004588 [Rhizophlyctis rosea]|nr:hypothetical protein HDV00_004588 [Rhizophlyctis rosea]